MSHAIGIDIGGTKIAAGLVADGVTIVERATEPTPDQPDAIAPLVAELVEKLRADYAIAGVGIGAAGFIAEDRSTVRFAPNINWVDAPLAHDVRALVDVPVVVENDANAAAWGEYRFGAGQGADDLILLTVGTGVGGGIVHAGEIFRGGFGIAAEFGHLRIVPDGIPCGCGQRGCLEQYASGSALVRDARDRVSAGDSGAGALTALADGDLSRITGPAITALAVDGDALCVELLATVGRWLGESAASLCAVLDPRVIALGGGVAAAGDLLLLPAIEAFTAHLPAREHRPVAELRLAQLGNTAGIVGAADLVVAEAN